MSKFNSSSSAERPDVALGRPQTEFQILFLAPSLNVVNDEISRS